MPRREHEKQQKTPHFCPWWLGPLLAKASATMERAAQVGFVERERPTGGRGRAALLRRPLA
jgi:hypothetical protein